MTIINIFEKLCLVGYITSKSRITLSFLCIPICRTLCVQIGLYFSQYEHEQIINLKITAQNILVLVVEDHESSLDYTFLHLNTIFLL
jgi:hypothetical protein